MKQTNLFLVAWMMLGVAFAACSDDDKDGGRYDGVYAEKTIEAYEYGEWSYFNFETGEIKKLTINKKEGAVTGLYKGSLKGTGMFASMVSIDEQPMVINRISADSVEITLSDFTADYSATVSNNYVYGVDAVEEAALDWDIAIHKYDIRTNGGMVKKMTTADLNAINVANLPAESEMVADTDGSVMVDMTNMQLGYVGFQDVKLNKELGGWVTATPTGTMPPYTYTLNDNVFVVKVDGKVWKMKFTAYTYGGKTAAKFYYGEVK